MNITVTITGDARILAAFQKMSAFKMDAIMIKQAAQISQRAAGPLGTPGATPRKTGELRISARLDPAGHSFGYIKEYAPHVEYGHRTRGGGYVAGQHYLQTNVETQAPIYKADVEKAIQEVLNA